jgi:hypothetical protein
MVLYYTYTDTYNLLLPTLPGNAILPRAVGPLVALTADFKHAKGDLKAAAEHDSYAEENGYITLSAIIRRWHDSISDMKDKVRAA